ncbi:Nitrogen fixation protein rnfB [Kingella potus]|uniref:Nitrogen fixation protein rnfB n=1 Tax=Kingella potus TaxID=265175 RepID=A0A377R5E0_9NEIS|nr:RnfABCDGE type electron transport complex subunit B [Kingella potus]STR03202.1 Nitrogen fixation protein rnfB [Kingella potus]
MNAVSSAEIDRLLPQTQCRECGYDGCLPYAEALAAGGAAVNLCAPGGEAVMLDIAGLLGKPPLAPVKIQLPALAWIDESACIGCTACIRACPVDAIMGASKLMHTVIAEECTGCGLCVAPCPVDCIYMRPSENRFLPQARTLSEAGLPPRFAAAAHARARYRKREARRAREEQEKKAERAAKEAAVRRTRAEGADKPPAAQSAFDPASLIAQAMARANAQQAQRSTPANRDSFNSRQIEADRRKAALRRYRRDAQYGSPQEKAAAIEWLRRHQDEGA